MTETRKANDDNLDDAVSPAVSTNESQIAFDKLNEALAVNLRPHGEPVGGKARREKPPHDPLEELAEDVFDVLQHVRHLEALHQQSVQQQASAINQLRRDLLVERGGAASIKVLASLAGQIERMERIARQLDQESDGRFIRQLEDTMHALIRCLEDLGFVAFRPEVGEPFDPLRMECVDYVEGERGVVLGVEHAGYTLGGVVRETAKVLIADPTAENAVSDEAEKRD